MKNYVYKFDFFSGFYKDTLYKQIKAKDEKQAILQIVSFFNNCDEKNTSQYLNKELGSNWTPEKFWSDMDLKFASDEGTEAYTLIWVQETEFDLDRL
ncbi:MAG: hypothetical protein EAZ55_11245 [Cytophagales bacterium]|nr:MAG: hypothetical protein EAZ55_11245 [Cytophagales bacterium]